MLSKGEEMEERSKLSTILAHWIEHNQSHIGEYEKWAQRAGVLGLEPVKTEIEKAIRKLSEANHNLEKALKVFNSSS